MARLHGWQVAADFQQGASIPHQGASIPHHGASPQTCVSLLMAWQLASPRNGDPREDLREPQCLTSVVTYFNSSVSCWLHGPTRLHVGKMTKRGECQKVGSLGDIWEAGSTALPLFPSESHRAHAQCAQPPPQPPSQPWPFGSAGEHQPADQ